MATVVVAAEAEAGAVEPKPQNDRMAGVEEESVADDSE